MIITDETDCEPAETARPLAPPKGVAADWHERIRRAIEAREAAERHWQGRYPVSRQTWPIRVHRG
jgi:hypothetical protein